MIGLWNSTETHAWQKTTSMYQTDAGKNVKMRRDLGDGSFQFFSSVEIVSLTSMAPWGRIALDKEQMLMSIALREVRQHPQLTTAGGQVDGLYILRPYDNNDILEQIVDKYRFASGELMFHLKEGEPAGHVPTVPYKVLSREI